MKRLNFNIKDRKILTLGLCMILVCVFTLTIAYAALSAVLTIQGSAQVTSADWDIHLANPKVTNGSVTTTVPTLATGKSLTFSTTLNMPGDFYEFTVDVVNSGSIDAMIEKVTKTPELTTDQAKYLNYEVSYQNGESITNKQVIASGVTMPIKVRVEYRKDLSSTDLPTGQVQLTLGLVLDYIQSDGTGTTVKDNGVYNPIKVVSGDINTVGSEIAIGDEHFYIISSDETNVNMLSKYNLHVGNQYTGSVTALTNPTGKQDKDAIGWFRGGGTTDKPYIGTIAFSSTNYWSSNVSEYPAYVYDSNSTLYSHIENYKNYLTSLGTTISDARLIKVEELESLGCSMGDYSCSGAPEWVYSTSYWSGSADNAYSVWSVCSDGSFDSNGYGYGGSSGVRPVISISKSLF